MLVLSQGINGISEEEEIIEKENNTQKNLY